MNFDGQVTSFDSMNRLYTINFNVSSEKFSISKGFANVQLRIGDTKVDIHNQDTYKLDEETHKYLRNKFLETIYNYNKEKISFITEAYKK